MNISLSDTLKEFVDAQISERGYSTSSEYVRDLIRRDKERAEADRMRALKAELQAAFAAPEDEYHPLNADAIIERNRRA